MTELNSKGTQNEREPAKDSSSISAYDLDNARLGNWPLRIYPPALKKHVSVIKELLFFYVLYFFGGNLLEQYWHDFCSSPFPSTLWFSLAALLCLSLLWREISYLRKTSWCLVQVLPTPATMSIIHEPRYYKWAFFRQPLIEISLPNNVDVLCFPHSMKDSELSAKYGYEKITVELWSSPVTGLPVAVGYKGEIILLEARKPKDWNEKRLLASEPEVDHDSQSRNY